MCRLSTKKKGFHTKRNSFRIIGVLSYIAIFQIWIATASGPQWWNDRGVIDSSAQPSDFGPANIGQLKAMATAAYDEMQQDLPGGAGPAVTSLVKSWFQLDNSGEFVLLAGKRLPKSNVDGSNYAAVNIGQLKTVTKPFYDRLIEIGYVGEYPWVFSSAQANDYAMANVGQVKNVFSFDLAQYRVAPQAPSDVTAIWNGSGMTVSWTSGGANQTVFLIERSVDGENWTSVGTVGGNSNGTTFTDSNVETGQQYQYRVSASNAGSNNGGGVSIASTAAATVAGPEIPILTYATITIGAYNEPAVRGMALGDDATAAYWYTDDSGDYTSVALYQGENGYQETVRIFPGIYAGVVYPSEPQYTITDVVGITAGGVIAANATLIPPGDGLAAAKVGLSSVVNQVGPTWLPFAETWITADEAKFDSSFIGCTPHGGGWGRLTSGGGPFAYRDDVSWPTYTTTWLTPGGSYFPGTAEANFEVVGLNTDSAAVIITWPFGGFSPLKLSYSGTDAVGWYSKVTDSPLTILFSSGPALKYPTLDSTAKLALWDGMDMKILSDQNASICGVDDNGRVVAAFPSLGNDYGIVYGDGAPVDIYTLIDPKYRRRVKFKDFVSMSSDGKVLFKASVLEVSSRIDRQVIFDIKTNELFIIHQDGVDAQYINSDKWLGKTQGGMAYVLVPVEFKLLNGSTPDFEGNVPTVLTHPDIDPDNPLVAYDYSGSGTYQLGELPMGTGRTDAPFIHQSYICSLLMMARVPSPHYGLSYSWNRTLRHRFWEIKRSPDGSKWIVTEEAGGGGLEQDMGDTEGYHTNVPSSKNVLYAYDCTGDNMSLYTDERIGDFVYGEKDFVYTIRVGVAAEFGVVECHVGQFMKSVRIDTSGVDAAGDWRGLGNIVSTTRVPDLTITEAKVRSVVGGDLPIVFDANN